MVACTLMRVEDEQAFSWVLRKFELCFQMRPLTILTDGDLALANAVRAQWTGTRHLLCAWHLARNVAKHVKGCFGAVGRGIANKEWRGWYTDFWAILHKTDAETKRTFEQEWCRLLTRLKDKGSATPAVLERAIAYLGSPPPARRRLGRATRGRRRRRRTEEIHSIRSATQVGISVYVVLFQSWRELHTARRGRLRTHQVSSPSWESPHSLVQKAGRRGQTP